MKPADNINDFFKNAGISTNPDRDRQVFETVLKAHNQTMNTQTAKSRPDVWRIIMKRPLTKLVTAAAVLLIAASAIVLLEHSATPAYAIEQTIEAMRNITSVHIVARGWDDELMDCWMQINPDTGKADCTYLKTPFIYEGRSFEFIIVSKPDVSYQYNVTENVVKVFRKQLIHPGIEFDRIFESLAENLDENDKMEIYLGKASESGNNIIVLLVQGEDQLTKFSIDPESKLPLGMETFGPKKTDLKRTERITYNEPLPQGIFDFTIPEKAKVVNESDIEALLDKPDTGIDVTGLSKEEASVLIAQEYWHAIINKDWSQVEKLRPIYSSDQWSKMHGDNPPTELLKVGQAYWQKGCAEPVTPCVVKFKNGSIFEIRTYPKFREVDSTRTCVIGGTSAQDKQLN